MCKRLRNLWDTQEPRTHARVLCHREAARRLTAEAEDARQPVNDVPHVHSAVVRVGEIEVCAIEQADAGAHSGQPKGERYCRGGKTACG